jgi:glutathione S-transferase
VLEESEVMMQYLDEGFAGRPLMPADARHRAELRLLATRLRAIDVHMEASKPAARRRSEPALRRLEEALQDQNRPYLHGDEPGLTDLLVWPFLTQNEGRGLLRAEDLPRTREYLTRAAARPSFRQTRPPWT